MFAAVLLLFSTPSRTLGNDQRDAQSSQSTVTLRVSGRLDKTIKESSGLVASRRQPGVLWTVSDSGHPPILYAVNHHGNLLAQFRISNAVNVDWESLAIDDSGNLYIADVGNNLSRTRFSQLLPRRWIYRIAEPKVSLKTVPADPQDKVATSISPASNDGSRETQEHLLPPLKELTSDKCYVFSYPDSSFDIEATFVIDQSLYLIAKSKQEPADLYRLSLADHRSGSSIQKVGRLTGCYFATGADFKAASGTLAVCSYDRIMIWRLGRFDSEIISRTEPQILRIRRGTYESIAFSETELVLTQENGTVEALKLPPLRNAVRK